MTKHFPWLAPLLFLAAITPFTPALDLAVARFFYQEGFVNNTFTSLMFKYGELVGLTLGVAALVVFLVSWPLPRWRVWRRGALALVLSLVIGAGLITNALLKEFWGRPRPRQVVEFGGKHPFRPYYKPNFHTRHDPQKSFPSGHTAIGFYYTSHALVGRRYRSRLLMGVGIFGTLFLGGGLMLTRLMMGGHFLSDTLFAAAIMWLTALFVDRLLFTSGGSGEPEWLLKARDTSPKPAPTESA